MNESTSNTFRITSAAIDYVYNHADTTQKYRNAHLVFENQSSIPNGRYQLSNPRISECKNFFEETVSHAINPEKKIGIARIELTNAHKMNLVSPRLENELIESFFKSKKDTPSFIVLD